MNDRLPERRAVPSWVKALLAVLVVLAVCCAVLASQLTRRNGQLDDVEDQIKALDVRIDELDAQLKAAEENTKRVREIAETYAEGDPEQSAALQEIFRKIDAIYQATVPEAQEG